MNWLFDGNTPLGQHCCSQKWRPIAAAMVVSLSLFGTPACSQTVPPNDSAVDVPTDAQADDIPEELQTAVDGMLEAANDRDLSAVMAFYDADFQHSDGLDLNEVSAVIDNFWDVYTELNYDATIQSWENTPEGLTATILTELTGAQVSERGDFELEAHSTVLNQFEYNDDGQLLLVSQEILDEFSRLTSGDAPPEVTLKIPSKVSIGAEFDLEAIVEQPLGESLLLGGAAEEPINAQSYLKSPALPLQPLQAGGLFRRADAPDLPGAEWVSVMLVSDGGIVIEGRRLQFVIGPTEY